MKLKYIPLLILCSCSSDPDIDLLPDVSTFEDEISLYSGIGTITVGQTRGDGIISGTLTADLPVAFVRIDKPLNGSYPADYSGINAIPATVTKANKVIAFDKDMPQYYLTDGGTTKFIGWYPQAGEWNETARTVTFPALDGTTDILVSPTVEGSKSNLFTAMQNRITFSHILTQVRIFAYLEDAAYGTLWGNLTAIAFTGKAQTCTLLLPASRTDAGASPTASFATSTTDLLLQKWTGSGPIESQSLTATVPDTEEDSPIGYTMFAPHTTGTDKLTLKVTTAKGGVQHIEIPYADMKLESGKSYDIVLKFQATGIEPTAIINEWETAPAEEQPAPIPIG